MRGLQHETVDLSAEGLAREVERAIALWESGSISTSGLASRVSEVRSIAKLRGVSLESFAETARLLRTLCGD